ncbi:MAG TPA: transcriptional regulator [Eubacterium sp.]|nr:transcriptional regulator [Eubacterium sp.]
MGREDENIEFKACFTEQIYKEVIAFANADGGTIFVGYDDDGNPVGLKDFDDEYIRITNGVRDVIMPDVTMFVKYTVQDNNTIRITVSEGANKPYYLKSKGLKPSGVYVRQGASSAPASPELIRQFIKQSDGDVYESMRSIRQDLTFKEAARVFEKHGVEFSEVKFGILGITQADKLFTNTGLLISDQCGHTIKIAVFGDEDKTVFRDSQEFSGSILEQLESAFRYLMLCNRTKAVFSGLERIEKTDYPEGALREALLNAVIHRDYSYSGSIIINVTDNEIEFISIGGLMPGLTVDDIKTGISQPRNKTIAEMFRRLHLIESYGTGIRKIFSLYKNYSRQPRIEVTGNTFKMVLPNMNSEVDVKTGDVSEQKGISPQMKEILVYIEDNGSISDEEIQNLLGVKRTRGFELTKRMRDMGLIEVLGRGKEKRYIVHNSQSFS